jgi:hypothetical protein
VWSLRNRVSLQNLGGDAKIIAETRFLGLSPGTQKPGLARLLQPQHRQNIRVIL